MPDVNAKIVEFDKIAAGLGAERLARRLGLSINLSALIGTVGLVDARILGLAKSISIAQLEKRKFGQTDAPPPPSGTVPPPAAPAASAQDDPASAGPVRVPDPASPDDDYAFLEDLDRAIAATAPTGEASEPETDTRPQPGLKCPDCGYSNDPAAWYCGVCGVDLG